MSIKTLYDKLTLQEIEMDVAEARKECDEYRIAPNQRRYFSLLADKYGLVDALMEQLRTVKNKKQLTTNEEIASLFGAKHYTSVTLYLKKCLDRKVYDIRVSLCLEEGGRRGGEECKNSENNHQFKKGHE